MYSLPFTPLYDELKTSLKYQNDKAGPVMEGTVESILQSVFENSDELENFLDGNFDQVNCILVKEEFWNSGFMCQVVFRDGYYTGYVLINSSHLNNDERRYLSLLEEKDEENYPEYIYVPHGGLTAHFGFDCCHSGDIWLSRHGIIDFGGLSPSTFKTKEFVIKELKKYSDSLRTYLINQSSNSYKSC